MIPAFLRIADVDRRQIVSAVAYVVVIGVLLTSAYSTAAALFADEARVVLLRERADQLNDRAKSSANAPTVKDLDEAKSPFLEGQTAALAGARLQQHIERVVADIGGTLSSSEINLNELESKNRFLSLTVTAEVTQAALQPLLYNIEAGLPYLFVDSFEAQAPESIDTAGRMRVTMNVSGQWESAQ